MKSTLAILLAIATTAAAIAVPAHGAGKIPDGARLAATCTGCHGTNGATQGNALPALAGRSREELLAALKDFKAGKRPATIMTQLAKGYTDEQLDIMAAYFAAQKK